MSTDVEIWRLVINIDMNGFTTYLEHAKEEIIDTQVANLILIDD